MTPAAKRITRKNLNEVRERENKTLRSSGEPRER